MKTIFPKEIIEYTTESHFVRFNSKVKIIYLLVLVLLVSFVVILPLVKVPVTQQSRGVVRSLNENNNIISAVYGQIAENRMYENLLVNKGDTLLVLNVEKLDNEVNSLLNNLSRNKGYMEDLELLLSLKPETLQTFLYQNELEEYKQNIIELDADIKQKRNDFDLNKTLYAKEVLARVDFEKVEYSYQQALQKKELYLKQKKLKWQTNLKDIVDENVDLESRISQINKEKLNYVITAPLAG